MNPLSTLTCCPCGAVLYLKNIRIWSFSGPHFPVFGLHTEICRVNVRIQSGCGKMRTRKTPNTGTFYAMVVITFDKVNSAYPELSFCKDSNPARDMPEVCCGEISMVRTCNKGADLKQGLKYFHWSTI